jgi:hypothetical protein
MKVADDHYSHPVRDLAKPNVTERLLRQLQAT